MHTMLITGATDGIGLATAKILAKQGNRLLIHGRSAEKLANTQHVLQQLGGAVETYRADLTDFAQVVVMTEQILASHHSLDVIINNAGVLKVAKPIAANGMDCRFVVNTFSPYIIIQRLLPLLSSEGRVINLSSAAQAAVDLSALKGETYLTDDFQAYAQSKLAITILTQQLAKEVKQVMLAVNPGSLLASKMVKDGFGIAGNDLRIGAEILVKAALSPEFAQASGQYFDNDNQRFASSPELSNHKMCEQVMSAIKEVTQAFV